MSDGIEIRAATNDDVDLVLAFIRDLAEYERLAHEVVATPELLRQSLFSDDPAATVLLASVNDEPAGFALYFRNFSTFLGRPGIYLEDLFVKPQFRSKGIGKKLLVELAGLAVSSGYGRLSWVVLDWNKPAIDFYTRLGAEIMSDWSVNCLTGQALKRLADSQ